MLGLRWRRSKVGWHEGGGGWQGGGDYGNVESDGNEEACLWLRITLTEEQHGREALDLPKQGSHCEGHCGALWDTVRHCEGHCEGHCMGHCEGHCEGLSDRREVVPTDTLSKWPFSLSLSRQHTHCRRHTAVAC